MVETRECGYGLNTDELMQDTDSKYYSLWNAQAKCFYSDNESSQKKCQSILSGKNQRGIRGGGGKKILGDDATVRITLPPVLDYLFPDKPLKQPIAGGKYGNDPSPPCHGIWFSSRSDTSTSSTPGALAVTACLWS